MLKKRQFKAILLEVAYTVRGNHNLCFSSTYLFFAHLYLKHDIITVECLMFPSAWDHLSHYRQQPTQQLKDTCSFVFSSAFWSCQFWKRQKATSKSGNGYPHLKESFFLSDSLRHSMNYVPKQKNWWLFCFSTFHLIQRWSYYSFKHQVCKSRITNNFADK